MPVLSFYFKGISLKGRLYYIFVHSLYVDST